MKLVLAVTRVIANLQSMYNAGTSGFVIKYNSVTIIHKPTKMTPFTKAFIGKSRSSRILIVLTSFRSIEQC